MTASSSNGDGHASPDAPSSAAPRLHPHAPAELTAAPLRRLGEGIGKVVYASSHWVVKRERSPSEILALVWIWKTMRKLERLLPGTLVRRVLDRPARSIRLLRLMTQAVVPLVPRSLWFATHTREVWKTYYYRARKGERLAQTYLSGTSLVPETIAFPPTRIAVKGWPGWITVEEATERVEETLHRRLTVLARERRFDEIEVWLNRLLDLRQSGWQRGVFSVDAHLKNFGVTEDRVVLLDSGGLTNRWEDIEERLRRDRAMPDPHAALGLGPMLRPRPDIAARFNERWRETVNEDQIRKLWPSREMREEACQGGAAGKVA